MGVQDLHHWTRLERFQICPIRAGFEANDERNLELEGVSHRFGREVGGVCQIRFSHFEQNLVEDLRQWLRGQASTAEHGVGVEEASPGNI